MASIDENTYYERQRLVFDSLLADVTAIKLAFDTAMTKLNNDATVTDTDYAGAPALTTTA